MIHWWICAGPIEPGSWLSEAEVRKLEELTVPKRRSDWLLGRWTAKQLVAAYLDRERGTTPPLESITIAADADGAPRVDLVEGTLEASLSISHSHGVSLCALSDDGPVGADIERVEPRDDRFVEDFFAPDEIAGVLSERGDRRDRLVTAIWSAKEAVLKALRIGLRADTRDIVCTPAEPSEDWSPVDVKCPAQPGDLRIRTWWRPYEGFVLSLSQFPDPAR